MVRHIQHDIFTVEADAIIQQCNCFHTMGSGIAAFIRTNFPEAYEVDCRTEKGDVKKLGTYSHAKVSNPQYPKVKCIINLYSQFDFGRDFRATRYDAMYDGLERIREAIRAKANGQKRTLAIPFRIGSNLGGGDWSIVLAIINSVFANADDFDVVICENPAISQTLGNSASK